MFYPLLHDLKLKLKIHGSKLISTKDIAKLCWMGECVPARAFSGLRSDGSVPHGYLIKTTLYSFMCLKILLIVFLPFGSDLPKFSERKSKSDFGSLLAPILTDYAVVDLFTKSTEIGTYFRYKLATSPFTLLRCAWK